MIIAKIHVSGVQAVAGEYITIPAGIVGAEVAFEFEDPVWDGLTKTAVFKANTITRDAVISGNVAKVPAEAVAVEGVRLLVGVFGSSGDAVQIPTLWAAAGLIRSAADPSGDPGTDPALPIWAQLQERVEALEAERPVDPDNPGTPGAPGKPGEDGGYYTPAVTQPAEDKIQFAFTPSKADMPAVNPVQVTLPSGGNVDLSGYLQRTELDEAVNDALAQAKASGEFNGADGKDGQNGKDGKDGYTPQKGVDYFDGKDGTNGKDGADGKTPVKGTDYYTEADKTEMVNAVLSALPTWTGGSY